MKPAYSDNVMFWWQRDEFAEQIGDFQTGASVDQPGADLLFDDHAVAAMQATPLGEPSSDFDVRSVFDSRPVNGYDFNYSAPFSQTGGASGAGWSVSFSVPNGYRAVPREWSVQFDQTIGGPSSNSVASLTQGNSSVPNNNAIIIGMGTDRPIKSFFLCEENTLFGISGRNNNTSSLTGSVVVYGNLIPTSDVALPLSIANQRLQGNN
jgi:hypothetical protein